MRCKPKKKKVCYIENIPNYNGIGIYSLIAPDGSVYIGSSKNVRNRIRQHNSLIKNNADMNALNGKRLVCEVVKKFPFGVTLRELIEEERATIEEYKRAGRILLNKTVPQTYSVSEYDCPIMDPDDECSKIMEEFRKEAMKITGLNKYDFISSALDFYTEYVIGSIKAERVQKIERDPVSKKNHFVTICSEEPVEVGYLPRSSGNL